MSTEGTVIDFLLFSTNYCSHLVSIVSSIKDANDMAKEHMENINEIQKILKETIVLAEQLESYLNI